MSDTCLWRATCLAQHVGGNGDGGPDGGVDSEEDHPEHHASPYRQVGKLQRGETDREKKESRGEGLQKRMEIKRQKERQHEVE